jgi:hypothetical protein
MRFLILLCLLPISTYAQSDYMQFYGMCLDANVSKALQHVPKDLAPDFEKRFKYETDQSDYLVRHSSDIDPLLNIFHNYWRKSLLDSTKKYEDEFKTAQTQFFKNESYKDYIKSKNLYSTDSIDKVGRLYDLLVWRRQTDTSYSFRIHREKLNVRVVLMQDFVSLGWEDYATLGKFYPGGWATPDALYCVSDAYDKKSEHFLVSYLAHEGRHLKDYTLFPGIKGKDLEYRAKLTELSLLDTTLFKLIQFFISNANANSENDHNIADYYVIRDLSKRLFHSDFETDIAKWKEQPKKRINKVAYQLLTENTKAMRNLYKSKKYDKG